jgi:D-alanyl-D-alanine carboxypeptidase
VSTLPDRLAARVEAWRERGDVPAVTVAIIDDTDDTWTFALGTPAKTQFRVASITKLFTATVVMLLVEDGQLSLDTPVGTFVPTYPAASAVTVRQLLNHTSGLPDYGTPDFSTGLVGDPTRHWDSASILETIEKFRPDFAPGTGWAYSNTNYVVLAEVIRGVTGRSWDVELRERVLEPLGLDDTSVAGFEPVQGDDLIDEAYFDLDNDGQVEDIEEGFGSWPALETSESAAGALVSTAEDVATFTAALFGGEVVSAASLEAMVTGGVSSRRYDDYGLGVELSHPDLQTAVWGHGGFLPGYRSVTWHVPASRNTITVLVNHSQANPADLAELLRTELH